MQYRRADGVDTINGRPVAFWRLQKPFLSQLGACAHLRRLGPQAAPERCFPFSFYGSPLTEEQARAIDPYHDEGGFPLDDRPGRAQTGATDLLELERQAWAGHGSGQGNPFGIRAVYREYFVTGDLSPLFNDDAWPLPGAWCPAGSPENSRGAEGRAAGGGVGGLGIVTIGSFGVRVSPAPLFLTWPTETPLSQTRQVPGGWPPGACATNLTLLSLG